MLAKQKLITEEERDIILKGIDQVCHPYRTESYNMFGLNSIVASVSDRVINLVLPLGQANVRFRDWPCNPHLNGSCRTIGGGGDRDRQIRVEERA